MTRPVLRSAIASHRPRRALGLQVPPALEKWLAAVLVLGAVLYLVPFVSRGWIPHDEGMLGQAAERALSGQLPHVDFDEAYTGGLTWIHAAIFAAFGIDLLYIRWLLFVASIPFVLVLYAVCRRILRPIGSAFAIWVAVTWSFPNYFAGLPSWWVLICALPCSWALMRYVEDRRIRYAALAGLFAGCAIGVKQTGVYLLPPLLMSLWVGAGTGSSSGPVRSVAIARFGQGLLGIGSVVVAAHILRSKLFAAEGFYLLTPIIAMSLAFVVIAWRTAEPLNDRSFVLSMMAAGAATVAPFLMLLIPYVAQGAGTEFFAGAFVRPQLRLSYASGAMPSAAFVVYGLVIIFWMVLTPPRLSTLEARWLMAMRLVVGAALVGWSLSSSNVYQFLWEGIRTIGTLVPIAAAWLLAREHRPPDARAKMLFAASAMLAWASLIQFPFAAPIYFCYVAPLVVVAALFVVNQPEAPRAQLAPFTAMVLVLAVLSLNRGYIRSLGFSHTVEKLDAPLDLSRGHLNVGDREAVVYRRTVQLVAQKGKDGMLMAAPDCPEIYFLTGKFSPTGTTFDFFDGDRGAATGDLLWRQASVVVINHSPDFSPPLTPDLLEAIRSTLTHGERVGHFEVRWR